MRHPSPTRHSAPSPTSGGLRTVWPTHHNPQPTHRLDRAEKPSQGGGRAWRVVPTRRSQSIDQRTNIQPARYLPQNNQSPTPRYFTPSPTSGGLRPVWPTRTHAQPTHHLECADKPSHGGGRAWRVMPTRQAQPIDHRTNILPARLLPQNNQCPPPRHGAPSPTSGGPRTARPTRPHAQPTHRLDSADKPSHGGGRAWRAVPARRVQPIDQRTVPTRQPLTHASTHMTAPRKYSWN